VIKDILAKNVRFHEFDKNKILLYFLIGSAFFSTPKEYKMFTKGPVYSDNVPFVGSSSAPSYTPSARNVIILEALAIARGFEEARTLTLKGGDTLHGRIEELNRRTGVAKISGTRVHVRDIIAVA
jgi:hypothetical protein